MAYKSNIKKDDSFSFSNFLSKAFNDLENLLDDEPTDFKRRKPLERRQSVKKCTTPIEPKDTNTEDTNTEDTNTEDTNTEDTNTEDTNTEDTNTEDTNTEDTNTEDTNTEDTNTEDDIVNIFEGGKPISYREHKMKQGYETEEQIKLLMKKYKMIDNSGSEYSDSDYDTDYDPYEESIRTGELQCLLSDSMTSDSSEHEQDEKYVCDGDVCILRQKIDCECGDECEGDIKPILNEYNWAEVKVTEEWNDDILKRFGFTPDDGIVNTVVTINQDNIDTPDTELNDFYTNRAEEELKEPEVEPIVPKPLPDIIVTTDSIDIPHSDELVDFYTNRAEEELKEPEVEPIVPKPLPDIIVTTDSIDIPHSDELVDFYTNRAEEELKDNDNGNVVQEPTELEGFVSDAWEQILSLKDIMEKRIVDMYERYESISDKDKKRVQEDINKIIIDVRDAINREQDIISIIDNTTEQSQDYQNAVEMFINENEEYSDTEVVKPEIKRLPKEDELDEEEEELLRQIENVGKKNQQQATSSWFFW